MTDFRNRIVGYGTKKASQFLAHPLNHRKHPQSQRRAMTASLTELGWVNAVIENVRTGRLIDGHERIWQALQADDAEVPFIQVDLAPEEEHLALAILDRITGMAEVDPAMLNALIEDVNTGEPALQELLAQMADEAGIVSGDESTVDAEPQIDKAEELRVKWGVETGQLWELGDHRIVCGDSTDDDVIRAVMGNDKAVLFCTDPPYGVNYGELQKAKCGRTKKWAKIENDNLGGDGTQEFLEKCFHAWLPFLVDNAAWYIWHAQKVQGYFTAAAAAAAQVLYHRQIVWVKPSLIPGRGHFHWRHELCLYGWREGHPPPEPKDRSANTVWEFKRDASQTYMHPTQKPLECFEWPMNYSTKRGDVVAEPFSGSGTQILAAENTGRRCRAIEISPGYVAVALQRWADATGKEPKLLTS